MTTARASDTLRGDLIFLPGSGSITRFDGGFRILTPSNPTYWWGNTLHFDRPPTADDVARWPALFRTLVHAVQPGSLHMTFGWSGDRRGAIEGFLDRGFRYDETIALAVDRNDVVIAPKPNRSAPVLPVAGDDWDSLLALMVETRDEAHSAAGYTEFMQRSFDSWQRLEAAGQGRWFAVRDAGRVIAALGVFAEAQRGADGRRIGRFQHVVTHPSKRRQGLAGTLVEHASRYAFAELDVDTLLIAADENDVARRVYEACGYRIRSRHRGLERGPRPDGDPSGSA